MKVNLQYLSEQKSLLKQYLIREFPLASSVSLRRPIFILGSSRSGTSILFKILEAHPYLHGFSENDLVRKQIFKIVGKSNSVEEQLPTLAKTIVRLSGIKSGERLLEKSPGHSLLAQSLADCFMDAQFIHIVRDGRDVAFSMLGHDWISTGLRGERKVFWFKLLPDQFQKQWRNLSPWERGVLRWAVYVSKAREVSSYEDRYLEIRYEDLCNSPYSYIENALSFLQLPVFSELSSRVSQIASHKRKRWEDRGLTAQEESFYQEVVSVFALDRKMPNDLNTNRI